MYRGNSSRRQSGNANTPVGNFRLGVAAGEPEKWKKYYQQTRKLCAVFRF